MNESATNEKKKRRAKNHARAFGGERAKILRMINHNVVIVYQFYPRDRKVLHHSAEMYFRWRERVIACTPIYERIVPLFAGNVVLLAEHLKLASACAT